MENLKSASSSNDCALAAGLRPVTINEIGHLCCRSVRVTLPATEGVARC
jgi:hypothetical protein